MPLTDEIGKTANYLVEVWSEGIISQQFTLVDVTAGGDKITQTRPTFGVLNRNQFECPSLSALLELDHFGLIKVKEGFTSTGGRKWDILLTQKLRDFTSKSTEKRQMSKYQLTDHQKTLLCSIVDGLKERYIDSEWLINTGDDRIVNIFGLNDKDGKGTLWREVWSGVTFADFADFVSNGFFSVSRYDHGRPSNFVLHKQRIIDACDNDLEVLASSMKVEKQIFVSYSRSDFDKYVKPVIGKLREEGLSVWIGQGLIQGGDDWLDKINEALEQCNLLILFLSPRSLNSQYVKMEYRYFLDENKPVIPIMCEEVRLPAELRSKHYLEYDEPDQLVEKIKGIIQTSG